MVVVTGPSAMEIMSQDGLYRSLDHVSSAQTWAYSRPSMTEVNRLAEFGISATKSEPLHVLVERKSDRLQSERVVNHLWSGKIPQGSLLYLVPGALVASPEFCYLQAARHGPEVAAAIGMEVCGRYGRNASARGFSDRIPISSVESLKKYLDGAAGAYGVKNAREGLLLVAEGSRSPLETKTSLLLASPVPHGGYALPQPRCNWLVPRPEGTVGLFRDPAYEIDLCWPDQMVALECDGYAYHSSKDALAHDAVKRNSLVSTGWTCLTATAAQLRGEELDILARQVAHALDFPFVQPCAEARDGLLAALS